MMQTNKKTSKTEPAYAKKANTVINSKVNKPIINDNMKQEGEKL